MLEAIAQGQGEVEELLAGGRTPLPERPDLAAISAWAVDAHRRSWGRTSVCGVPAKSRRAARPGRGMITDMTGTEVTPMKLAEALALRADAKRRAEQLRARIVASARYQEGEEPAEDAAGLLTEADAVLGELEGWIRRINRTNAATALDGGEVLSDAIARRDVLRMRHSLVTAAADAAAGRDGRHAVGFGRQLRSELRQLAALPVAQLRGRADQLAREQRELDVRIQRANWEVDLLES